MRRTAGCPPSTCPSPIMAGSVCKGVALAVTILTLLAVFCHANSEESAGVVLKSVLQQYPKEQQVTSATSFWENVFPNLRAWPSEDQDRHTHWPKLELNWRNAAGTLIGFLGAALGSVGGVGGGGFFLPMLTLVIGFDSKTATAVSKSMIMGSTLFSVIFNLNRKHPTKDKPVVDYDAALLFQPMLLLGISLGVAFNVMFADWMVTLLLIVILSCCVGLMLVGPHIYHLSAAISWNAFCKAFATWNAETLLAKDQRVFVVFYSFWIIHKLCMAKAQEQDALSRIANPDTCVTDVAEEEGAYMPLSSSESPSVGLSIESHTTPWNHIRLLVVVWIVFLSVQILKIHVRTCGVWYWVLNCSQIPIALGVAGYQAAAMNRKEQVMLEETSKSRGELEYGWWKLLLYAGSATGAGMVGGLLGVGGGTIIGPFFLELGMPPEVTSATATFVMLFSSSLSVVEYYLLGRLPTAFAVYLTSVAAVAALVGQSVVRRIVCASGKASIIIFVLAFCVVIGLVVLGLEGILKVLQEWETEAYMGFQSVCQESKT